MPDCPPYGLCEHRRQCLEYYSARWSSFGLSLWTETCFWIVRSVSNALEFQIKFKINYFLKFSIMTLELIQNCPVVSPKLQWLTNFQWGILWDITNYFLSCNKPQGETANVGLDSSVGRAPARQSGGRRFKSRSSQFSLFIQIYLKSVPSQFPLVVYYMTFIKKSYPFMGASPHCLFPGRIVTWAWSLAKGQYMVSWPLTGAPEQRYWQNRETANVGLDSSVGRAPARQSGGRRFKSRSCQFSLFIQIYLKSVPSQFPLWFITWHL